MTRAAIGAPRRPGPPARCSARAPLRACLRLAVAALCAAGPSAAAEGATDALPYTTQRLEVAGETREVRLPRGLALEVLATGLDQPRMLVFGEAGELLVGSIEGAVYRLRPPYTEAEVLLRLDDLPHGVALRGDELFIGRTGGLYRVAYRAGQTTLDPADVELLAPLPAEGPHHKTRTVGVGPDGRVYVSLGMTGNCGDNYLDESYPFEARRGGIFVWREDVSPPRLEPYGSGLRNPVGFAWHPSSGALYATNNGPDHWGFELPPEYLARVLPGSFHGMPWFQFDGRQLRRDSCIESDPPRPVEEVSRPAAVFPAHQAPLGIAFVPPGALGAGLAGDAVVALHGSWVSVRTASERRQPKLVRVRFDGHEARGVEDLVTGFQLDDGKRWLRPVGVAFGPDGALYFTSDRKPGALYRLRRAE